MIVPARTTEPAATSALSPTSALSRTVAFIPISVPCRMVQAWTTALWPRVTSSSRTSGPVSFVTWSVQLSWTLLRAPIRIQQQSPRTTEEYQIETSSPSTTSPIDGGRLGEKHPLAESRRGSLVRADDHEKTPAEDTRTTHGDPLHRILCDLVRDL